MGLVLLCFWYVHHVVYEFVVPLFIIDCFHSEMILKVYAGQLSGFLGFFDEC